jgi:hypothetical protein
VDSARVTSFNYAPGRFRTRSTYGNARIRLAVAAIGASLVFVTAAWSFETQRLTRLDDELGVMQSRAREARAAEDRLRRAQMTLDRLRLIDAELTAARQAAIATTNAVARIGNGLPPQTWLTDVRAAATGTWTIAGRTSRVAEVGSTLRSIQRLDRSTVARLVSIEAAGRSGRVLDFAIDWDPVP